MESTAAGVKDISETSSEVKIKSEDTKETVGDASYLTSKEVKCTSEDAGTPSEDKEGTENNTAPGAVMTVVPVRCLNSHEEEEELEKWWRLMERLMESSSFRDILNITWIPKSAV